MEFSSLTMPTDFRCKFRPSELTVSFCLFQMTKPTPKPLLRMCVFFPRVRRRVGMVPRSSLKEEEVGLAASVERRSV